jgi:hypothetical protein
MRIFIDRNISLYIAEMLAIYCRGDRGDHEIRHLDNDERFNIDTPDVDWLRILAQDVPTWIVISADCAILNNEAERKALEESGLTFIGFAKQWLRLRFEDQVWMLMRAWPDILRTLASLDSQTIFKVAWGRSHKIEEEWRGRRRGH